MPSLKLISIPASVDAAAFNLIRLSLISTVVEFIIVFVPWTSKSPFITTLPVLLSWTAGSIVSVGPPLIISVVKLVKVPIPLLIFTFLISTEPVPFGSIIILPFVFVDEIILVSILILSTLNSLQGTFVPIVTLSILPLLISTVSATKLASVVIPALLTVNLSVPSLSCILNILAVWLFDPLTLRVISLLLLPIILAFAAVSVVKLPLGIDNVSDHTGGPSGPLLLSISPIFPGLSFILIAPDWPILNFSVITPWLAV